MNFRILLSAFAVLGVILLSLTLLATNSNRDKMRYIGKWAGTFEVESVSRGADTESERKRWRLEGYLQVYLTGHRYLYHFDGEQQGIEVTGTWVNQNDRLTLTPKHVAIDDHGGADKRDPNKKYIANDDVQAALNRPIILVQSADHQSFTSLPVSIGPLLGKYNLHKDGY